jgi:hypothetical protein
MNKKTFDTATKSYLVPLVPQQGPKLVRVSKHANAKRSKKGKK